MLIELSGREIKIYLYLFKPYEVHDGRLSGLVAKEQCSQQNHVKFEMRFHSCVQIASQSSLSLLYWPTCGPGHKNPAASLGEGSCRVELEAQLSDHLSEMCFLVPRTSPTERCS